MDLEIGICVFLPAEFPAELGELTSQLLVGLPKLLAECRGSLAVAGCRWLPRRAVPSFPRLRA